MRRGPRTACLTAALAAGITATASADGGYEAKFIGQSAYLTLAVEAGLDFVLGNPEKNLHLLDRDDRFVRGIEEALAAGRPTDGETQEEAGFRQASKIIEMFQHHDDH